MKKKTILRRIRKRVRPLIKNNFINSLICLMLFLYVKLIKNTSTWQRRGVREFKKFIKDDSAILCSWHQRIVMLPTFSTKSNKVNALVSLHRDGQIIAGLLKRFDFGIVGGSSNNNAKAAAVALMRCLKNKESIAIIPDGPRGPAKKMTPSPIYYAHKTGRPIIAAAYSTSNALIIKKSWDRLMVPLPFSKGAFTFSKPFYVPKDASPEDLEKYMQEFEKILNQTTKKADKLVGRK